MNIRSVKTKIVSFLMICVYALSSCEDPKETLQTVPPGHSRATREVFTDDPPTEPEEERDFIAFAEHFPEENPDLPYAADFESGGWTDYAHRRSQYSFCEWYYDEIGEPTADFAGNPVDEKTVVIKQKALKEREPIPPGANGPAIYFGNSELRDYRFSFDVLLNNDTLKFEIYGQSLITDWDPESEDPKRQTQPFWWELSKEGLFVAGVFGKGSRFQETADGEVMLKGLDTSVWHHIELKPAGSGLRLLLNGEDLGEIYSFEGAQVGAAALSGARGGCMFKNIRLLPLSGDETRE